LIFLLLVILFNFSMQAYGLEIVRKMVCMQNM
jgi:hypothetical protein